MSLTYASSIIFNGVFGQVDNRDLVSIKIKIDEVNIGYIACTADECSSSVRQKRRAYQNIDNRKDGLWVGFSLIHCGGCEFHR